MHPITAFEQPFSRILVDCVGPLTKTKSEKCICLPLCNIYKVLIKFFTVYGLRKEVSLIRDLPFCQE